MKMHQKFVSHPKIIVPCIINKKLTQHHPSIPLPLQNEKVHMAVHNYMRQETPRIL